MKQSSQNEILRLLETADEHELHALQEAWDIFSHEHQLPPACANNGEAWTTWLLIGGRGAGKTRAGAEWVKRIASAEGGRRGRTAHRADRRDRARDPRGDDRGRVRHAPVHAAGDAADMVPSRRRLEWNNGTVAEAFSAEDPESLRGPQFPPPGRDELAKWRHAEATFDMLQFGLRLGERPRQVITTTPRPIALLKRLIADPSTAVTHAATRANARHLSPAFIDTVLTRYDGTRLGRQELDGEIVEDRPDALWSRALIEKCRVAARRASAHRGGGRSAGVGGAKARTPAGWSRPGALRTARVYVIADETVGGPFARRLGRACDRAVAKIAGGRAGGRGQPGRRHGEERDPAKPMPPCR